MASKRENPSTPCVAMVSFRLGGVDGVSVEAAKWAWALGQLGYRVTTVAGAGPVDHLLPGLGVGADVTGTAAPPLDRDHFAAAVADADVVVVENLCSLPLNPQAAAVVADCLRGRPAVLHHHDLPWQRARSATAPPPPDDRAWAHVTINDRSRLELAQRGITAITVGNAFDTDPPRGDRQATRQALGVADDCRLLLQPTRAIGRKNIPAALALAEATEATLWILGPAEEGYEEELVKLVEASSAPVLRGPVPPMDGHRGIEHSYAACDAVSFPSLWEGFGNPPLEASVAGRQVAVGPYPVGQELLSRGFRWLDALQPAQLHRWFEHPDDEVLAHNRAVVKAQFDLRDLPGRLEAVLRSAGA